MKTFSESDLKGLYRPPKDSHKGQNGRVLVIGGSKLFHSSIFWSADTASRWVDLVHFTSPANENNEVVRKRIKEGFWGGIVVDWGDIDSYIEEDDVVLIGPGMTRSLEREIPNSKFQITDGEQISNDQNVSDNRAIEQSSDLDEAAKSDDTEEIVNTLLKRYPEKRWVVDGGALQEVDPKLLNGNMIVTPHRGELKRMVDKTNDEFLISNFQFLNNDQTTNDEIQKRGEYLSRLSEKLNRATVLSKAVVDVVVKDEEVVIVEGGNEGLTKGGTGDILAGLTAAFYCKNDSMLAAAAASYVVKKAADKLYGERGTFYNAADVIEGVGRVIKMIY